ncbi:hypothetical protein GCM10011491_11200 [Brucella endophytica]|uniref:Lipoprotein n=1 Tax=Brucella endophytica TaxID=1963359 RepID=A0A916WCH0_9HYPH|nr:hypothetical protein [Brucella endophytica]GGA85378.1 hypothetical protein GCM10011491_11200 [Brucella endophytica]
MFAGNLRLRGWTRAVLAVIIAAFVVTGCTTRDPRLVEALKGVRITEIQVESTPDVATGLPMINGKTPEQQVAIVENALRAVATRDLKGYPGGSSPTRLVITLQRADLASAQGRVLMGSNSSITGTVRLEDVSTGRLIAQNPRIYGENRGVKGGDLGGHLIAIAINAAMTKSQEALAEKLATDFVGHVKTWLTPK